MNQRIRELIKQAQDWADAHAPYASEEQEYFAEKFAELIVRECAKELDDRTVFVRGVRAGTWIKNFMGIEE